MRTICASCGAKFETACAEPRLEPRCRACSRIAVGVRIRELKPPHASWRRYLFLPLLPIVSFVLMVALRFALDAA